MAPLIPLDTDTGKLDTTVPATRGTPPVWVEATSLRLGGPVQSLIAGATFIIVATVNGTVTVAALNAL